MMKKIAIMYIIVVKIVIGKSQENIIKGLLRKQKVKIIKIYIIISESIRIIHIIMEKTEIILLFLNIKKLIISIIRVIILNFINFLFKIIIKIII